MFNYKRVSYLLFFLVLILWSAFFFLFITGEFLFCNKYDNFYRDFIAVNSVFTVALLSIYLPYSIKHLKEEKEFLSKIINKVETLYNVIALTRRKLRERNCLSSDYDKINENTLIKVSVLKKELSKISETELTIDNIINDVKRVQNNKLDTTSIIKDLECMRLYLSYLVQCREKLPDQVNLKLNINELNYSIKKKKFCNCGINIIDSEYVAIVKSFIEKNEDENIYRKLIYNRKELILDKLNQFS